MKNRYSIDHKGKTLANVNDNWIVPHFFVDNFLNRADYGKDNSGTPNERYNDLIFTYPNVFQKAAQYHIASYLGISPQHLSRLRGQKTIS